MATPSLSQPTSMKMFLSLAGVLLIAVGLCLPMLLQHNPNLPASTPYYRVYEWTVVFNTSTNTLFTLGFGVFAVIPLLSALLVLVNAIMTLMHRNVPNLTPLNRVMAMTGLVVQMLFDLVVYMLLGIAYAQEFIGWGLPVILLGFIVMVIGVW